MPINETVMNYLVKALLLFTAVPVHECAHAWVADKLGDDTPRKQGRVTLNPFAHLTLWGSLMMIAVGFGWGKPVGIDVRNFKKPKRDMMLSSLAGPVANFIMATLAMAVFKICIIGGYFSENGTLLAVGDVFRYITLINVSLGVFNFLPIPPLDGSKIFNSILPEKWYFTIMKYEQYVMIALIILLYAGLLNGPLGFLQEKAIAAMDILTRWVDILMAVILGASA